ncbi:MULTISPECIES: ABC transporter permease [unclassified Paenibacillus]|uniref:ABC transporter permease n=1 Tax=unclassified Paenibacillus TaxID=185978 RepID=UPI000839D82C|nr:MULTISPECIES: ABC transporter permease [unclassified Paenibacillus]NWL86867.1 ABC transporter permease [Paenibacillus sp. 79R4]
MLKDISWLVITLLRTTFRKRSNLILYLGLPLAGILFSLLIYSGNGQGGLHVGVVNEDGAEIAANTISFLQGLDQVEVKNVTEAEMQKQLAAGKLDSGLILQKGYSDSVLAGEPAHITIQSLKGAQVTAYMKAMLYIYIDNFAAVGQISGGDPSRYQQLYEDYQSQGFHLTANTLNDKSATVAMSSQSIGFLIMFMMMSAINLSELILKGREDRTYFRIMSSPITPRTYVISNIIVNFIVMLIQIGFTVMCIRYVFKFETGIPLYQLVGLLALFALISVGISLSIVAFSKSSGMSGALQNLIVTPSCLLAGCFFPIDIMPAFLRRIADFLPQHWVLQTISQLQEGGSFTSIGFNLLVLGGFIVVFFLLASYKFKRMNDIRNFV